MSQPFLSVIIPAYNEAERLPLTLVAIDKYLQGVNYPYEILVVNDGSTDTTAAIVKKMSEIVKNLKLIDNKTNQGKGAVVKQGMLLAKGRYRLFTDADNSTAIDHFEKMLPYLDQGCEVIIGSRTIKGSVLEPAQPLYKQALGKLSNLVIQIVNVPGIWDTQCGFKAFTDEAAEKIFSIARTNGWGFDIEVLALARCFGYQIKEIPVKWVNSPLSHVQPSAYLKTFLENIKIRWWILSNKYEIRNPKS